MIQLKPGVEKPASRCGAVREATRRLQASSAFKVPMAFGALVILVACSMELHPLIVWMHQRFPG